MLKILASVRNEVHSRDQILASYCILISSTADTRILAGFKGFFSSLKNW